MEFVVKHTALIKLITDGLENAARNTNSEKLRQQHTEAREAILAADEDEQLSFLHRQFDSLQFVIQKIYEDLEDETIH